MRIIFYKIKMIRVKSKGYYIKVSNNQNLW